MDHPRACGEHGHVCLYPVIYLGSSPRMRGTHRTFHRRVCNRGIIPAHAGNTKASATVYCRAWDHPRACGEHENRYYDREIGVGSSPRMRGTHNHVIVVVCVIGIIPAHAGNTHMFACTQSYIWDHPRACGEHIERFIVGFATEGSSPRMRGTPNHVIVVVCVIGIIPAHAGNTRFSSPPRP